MEVTMKSKASGLFLFVCFAITFAKEVSYYPSVFPASECYPVLATNVVVTAGVEKKIAGFNVGIIEKYPRSMLHCFKIPPGFFKNTTVCVCRLYHLDKIVSTEEYFDNNLESFVEDVSLPTADGCFSRIGTVIWMFFYTQILYYAYHTIVKCVSQDFVSTKSKRLRQSSSSSSSSQLSELDLGEGLGTLYALPILPSNFDPSPSNMELEVRGKNEYVFIRRPFPRPMVEKWLEDQILSKESKENVFDGRKSRCKEETSTIYDPQCGFSGFLINHQRSEIFLEGIPGYNDEKPSRCWGSMHNIGEHIETISKPWRRSLPNICAKWSFNNKPGYSLLPDSLMEEENDGFEWRSSSVSCESDEDLDSISVAYLRHFYQRYLRRKRARANGLALSSTTSRESCYSSDLTSCGVSTSALSNASTVLNVATTSFEETSQSFSQDSLPRHPPAPPVGMWRLYRYPIPPSITSSSPFREYERHANEEYIFIQRPYQVPHVHKWLQDTRHVLSTENMMENTSGYSSYLINSERTEVIIQGVPGYRHKVKPKFWSSMHQIGEVNKRLYGKHASLPNILDELGFKHESNFNEHTLKPFVVKTNEGCRDEAQSNRQLCEGNLESISISYDREMQIDEARRQAARAKAEENVARQLALRQHIEQPRPKRKKIISEFFLDEIKREFREQVFVPLALNTGKVIFMEFLRLF